MESPKFIEVARNIKKKRARKENINVESKRRVRIIFPITFPLIPNNTTHIPGAKKKQKKYFASGYTLKKCDAAQNIQK